MKLLANENFPAASVVMLRSLGYDVVSIGEDDPSITDEKVMQVAIKENRLILTFDRDYGELIFKHGYRPVEGVIYLRMEPLYPTYPAEVIHQLFQSADFQFIGKLTVVDKYKVRQKRFI